MLFCHLGRADSLREICHGLAWRRSWCTSGSAGRPSARRCPRQRPSAGGPVRGSVLALGRSPAESGGPRSAQEEVPLQEQADEPGLDDHLAVPVAVSVGPLSTRQGWGQGDVLLDHDDYMPSYVLLTEARRHDRMGARLLRLNPGSIVAMDRAYNDYQLFADWTAAGIFFVTRLKDRRRLRSHRRAPGAEKPRFSPTRASWARSEEVPRPPAPGGRVGRGQPAPDRAAQPLGVRGHHDRRHLPDLELFFKTLKQHPR